MKFSDLIIQNTVEKLLKGEDYRDEIINAINVEFLDFALAFFRQILDAKLSEKSINIDWYKKSFINNENLDSNELAIFAGINKKTITNIYGSAKRQITLDAANANIKYLEGILKSLEELGEERLGLSIKISHKNVSVELNLSESLIVINALATKKTPCEAPLKIEFLELKNNKNCLGEFRELCQRLGVPLDSIF